MAIFKTPTPIYQQQPGHGQRVPTHGMLGWFASLIRTPTPGYQTLPPSTTEQATRTLDENVQADKPPDGK